MNVRDLELLVDDIITTVNALKEQYIAEPLGDIDYVGIALPTPNELQDLIVFVTSLGGKVVYVDDWGSVDRLPQPINTISRPLNLLKICHPAEAGKDHKSYVDFQAANYKELNKKYKDKPNFVKIVGECDEVLGIRDKALKVSLFIPEFPLSHDLQT